MDGSLSRWVCMAKWTQERVQLASHAHGPGFDIPLRKRWVEVYSQSLSHYDLLWVLYFSFRNFGLPSWKVNPTLSKKCQFRYILTRFDKIVSKATSVRYIAFFHAYDETESLWCHTHWTHNCRKQIQQMWLAEQLYSFLVRVCFSEAGK